MRKRIAGLPSAQRFRRDGLLSCCEPLTYPRHDWREARTMAISLYDVSVAGFQQTLQGVAAFLDKGAEHFKAAGGSPDQVLDASLAPRHAAVPRRSSPPSTIRAARSRA